MSNVLRFFGGQSIVDLVFFIGSLRLELCLSNVEKIFFELFLFDLSSLL